MYKFFDHQADIGIIGIGKTQEEAFQEAAKAMFSTMCDIKAVKPSKSISIEASSSDITGLLVDWLNNLLSQKDIEDMLFSKFEVEIKKEGKDYKLLGVARGEKLNPKKHHLKVEVKAATYSQLKVFKSGTKYKAQCVVDV